MAIEARPRLIKGRRKVFSYRVKWRYKGSGEQQSYTVDTRQDAEALEEALKAADWAYKRTDPEVKTGALYGKVVTVKPESPQALDNTTVAEAVFRWAHRPALSEGSERIYDKAHQRLGTFGDVLVRDVTVDQVNEWYKTTGKTKSLVNPKKKLSSNTMNSARIAVAGALRVYGRHDALVDVKGIEAVREVEPIYLTALQLDTLVETARRLYGDNFATAIRLAGTIGLRWGECFGLQPRHLHLEEEDRPYLWVRQAIHNDDRQKNGFQPGKVKSRASERLVPLPVATGKLLRDIVDGRSEDAPVFKPANSTFLNYRTFGHWWNRVRTQAEGVPNNLRFHDLRHTAAKDMLEKGVPISYLSKMLGHSKVDVTIKEYGSFDTRSHDLVRSLLG